MTNPCMTCDRTQCLDCGAAAALDKRVVSRRVQKRLHCNVEFRQGWYFARPQAFERFNDALFLEDPTRPGGWCRNPARPPLPDIPPEAYA